MHTYRPARLRRFPHGLYELLSYRRQALTGPWLAVDETYLYAEGRRIRLLDLQRVIHRRKHSHPASSLFTFALAALTIGADPTNPWMITAAVIFLTSALIQAMPATTAKLKTTSGERITYTVWGCCTELERFSETCFDTLIIAKKRASGFTGDGIPDDCYFFG